MRFSYMRDLVLVYNAENVFIIYGIKQIIIIVNQIDFHSPHLATNEDRLHLRKYASAVPLIVDSSELRFVDY